MRKTFLLLVLLPACGSPFVTGIPEPDAGADHDPMAESGPDVVPGREASRDPDSWTDSESPIGDSHVDSGSDVVVDHDTSSGHDSGHDSGSPDTGYPDTEPSDTSCAPSPPSTIICGGVMMNEPENYCVSYGGGGYITPTPAECQCAATYNCACLEAHGICPMGTLIMCVGPGLVECS